MLLRCIVVANTGDFHNGSIVDDGSLNLLIYQSIDLLMSSYIIIKQTIHQQLRALQSGKVDKYVTEIPGNRVRYQP